MVMWFVDIEKPENSKDSIRLHYESFHEIKLTKNSWTKERHIFSMFVLDRNVIMDTRQRNITIVSLNLKSSFTLQSSLKFHETLQRHLFSAMLFTINVTFFYSFVVQN